MATPDGSALPALLQREGLDLSRSHAVRSNFRTRLLRQDRSSQKTEQGVSVPAAVARTRCAMAPPVIPPS